MIRLWPSKGHLQHMERIERQFMPRLKARTAQEWLAEGLMRKIPIGPVPEIPDLLRGARSAWRRRGPNGWLDAATHIDAAAQGQQGSGPG